MSVLQFLFDKESRMPVKKIIAELKTHLDKVGYSPTYPQCESICLSTRWIWRKLFRRYLDDPYGDGIINMPDKNEWLEAAVANPAEGGISLYRDALEVFEIAQDKLRLAEGDASITGGDRTHVEGMIANNAERIRWLNILLGENETIDSKLRSIRTEPAMAA